MGENYLQYCRTCLTTNLRPNASIVEGQCIACKYSENEQELNSGVKLHYLRERIKKTRRKKRQSNSYDCIVGVSGGKDSSRQAHWVRDRLNLRPLLICAAYPPQQMTEIGAKNLSNLITLGFDMLTVTPAPKTSKQLTLESFMKFGNVCKSTEMALFSTVPRLAIDLGINTIFWGENPALQVGDSAVLGVDEFDGNNLRNLNTLTDGGHDWMRKIVQQTYKFDHYIYPDEITFLKKKIDIFYLGAAWDDWSTKDNATYASLQGLTLRVDEELDTGDISNASMLDEEFTNINMMLKYYKYGFGRATDHMNEMIRNKDISRSKAIEIVEIFDGACSDEIIWSFCNYVEIATDEFWDICKSWVNKKLFDVTGAGRPRAKFKVGVDFAG